MPSSLIHFAHYSRVATVTNSEIKFGLIPTEHWKQPDSIDEDKATKEREKMVANNVIYGGEHRIARARPSANADLVLQAVYREFLNFNAGQSSPLSECVCIVGIATCADSTLGWVVRGPCAKPVR